jgi:hypothetical protein
MTIQEFPLAWRWTQSEHAVLPPDVLERIRPLSSAESAQVHESSNFPRSSAADSRSTEDATGVRTWLRRVQPDLQARVFVSWSENLAVETNWDIFIEYWDDFCYPSSDDVTIVPIAGGWRLIYHHYEQFEFVP